MSGGFRDWIDQYGDDIRLGTRVFPAASLNKIMKNAKPHEGDLRESVKAFKHGGKVVGKSGNKVLVETTEGNFFVSTSLVIGD